MAGNSGIYIIVNTNNLKYYIGSAKNIEGQFKAIIGELNKGAYHNKPLQRAWTKTAGKVFNFSVIKRCASNVNALLKNEQIELDKAGAKDFTPKGQELWNGVYNTSRIAGGVYDTTISRDENLAIAEALDSEELHPFWVKFQYGMNFENDVYLKRVSRDERPTLHLNAQKVSSRELRLAFEESHRPTRFTFKDVLLIAYKRQAQGLAVGVKTLWQTSEQEFET